jgi:hypothetical protein
MEYLAIGFAAGVAITVLRNFIDAKKEIHQAEDSLAVW